MNAIRAAVSGPRKRYTKDGFDLDLTYIAPHLIAMGYPASGMEKTYRNNISQVATMLNVHHGDKYRIYNLSERSYDYNKFGGRVREYGFPDHHPPPLQMLLDIMNDMMEWRAQSEDNVCVVHCMAGKGRTGIVCSCYLLLTGQHGDIYGNYSDKILLEMATTSIRDFWQSRGQGVRYPSQARYIYYFIKVVRSLRQTPRQIPKLQPPVKKILKKVVLRGIPDIQNKGFTPILQVLPAPSQDQKVKLLYNSTWQKSEFDSYQASPRRTLEFLPNCEIQGDTLIRCFHANGRSIMGKHVMQIFHFTFHADFVSKDENVIFSLPKKEIDGASSSDKFPDTFRIDCHIEPIGASRVSENNPRSSDLTYQNSEKRMHLQTYHHKGISIPEQTRRLSSSTSQSSNDLELPTSMDLRNSYEINSSYQFHLTKQEASITSFPSTSSTINAYRDEDSLYGNSSHGSEQKVMGWLVKQGGFIKNWKKRWFVGHGTSLLYYSSTSAPTPLGSVDLQYTQAKICDNKETTGLTQGLYYFKVVPSSPKYRTFYFGAANDVEMKKWLSFITMQSGLGNLPGKRISYPQFSSSIPMSRSMDMYMNSQDKKLDVSNQSTLDQIHIPRHSISDSPNARSTMPNLTHRISREYRGHSMPPENFCKDSVCRPSVPSSQSTIQRRSSLVSQENVAFEGVGLGCKQPETIPPQQHLIRRNSNSLGNNSDLRDVHGDRMLLAAQKLQNPPELTQKERQSVFEEVSNCVNNDSTYIYSNEELEAAAALQNTLQESMSTFGLSENTYRISAEGMNPSTYDNSSDTQPVISLSDHLRSLMMRKQCLTAQSLLLDVLLRKYPILIDAMEFDPMAFTQMIIQNTTSNSSLSSQPQHINHCASTDYRYSKQNTLGESNEIDTSVTQF